MMKLLPRFIRYSLLKNRVLSPGRSEICEPVARSI